MARQCCQMTSESKGHFGPEPRFPILLTSIRKMSRRILYEIADKILKDSPKLRVGTIADPLSAGCIERIKRRFAQCICHYPATTL